MNICITGGVGAGKSVVSKCIQVLGYPVFNSDVEAKLILSEDQSAREEIINHFGRAAYNGKVLNRTYLADIVFKDESARGIINQIVHPRVRQKFADYSEVQSSPLVFNEAAILFETGAYKSFDKSILVTASEETRIQRVMERDNASREQVMERMNAQWSDEQKRKLADFEIVNDANQPILIQIEKIINQLT